MKINVKTLKGKSFPVEVNPEDTVAQVKQTIESQQGAAVYPANQQLLIHKGKVLADTTTLVQNEVAENSFLVIMLSKPKNPSNPGQSSSNPSVTAPAAPPAAVAASSPPPAAATSPPPAASPPEGIIQQILEMGGGMWDREIVVRALTAAANNPDRAIDFLYSGIPLQQVAAPPAATTTPLPQQPANSPNVNPLNLFPQGLPNVTTNTADTVTGLGAGTGTGTGVFDFMRNDPQFEVMKAMVLQQPELAGEIIQNLSAQVPDIARLIQENQEEFTRYLNEPINNDIIREEFLRRVAEDQQEGQQTVTLTQEEAQAVERLQALGFDQQEVLQAYIAHDKNEELTANYLLDSMNDV